MADLPSASGRPREAACWGQDQCQEPIHGRPTTRWPSIGQERETKKTFSGYVGWVLDKDAVDQVLVTELNVGQVMVKQVCDQQITNNLATVGITNCRQSNVNLW